MFGILRRSNKMTSKNRFRPLTLACILPCILFCFSPGCGSVHSTTPETYNLIPFYGFGPNGQSIRSYRMEERSADPKLVLTPQNSLTN